MMNLRLPLFLSIILLFSISSCRIEKRNYRPGYYITWNHSSANSSITKIVDSDTVLDGEASAELQFDKSVTASLENDPLVMGGNTSNFVADSCADKLFLKDGSTIDAQVLEILPTEIKYKTCLGSVRVIPRSTLRKIQFQNGNVEYMDKDELANDDEKNKTPSKEKRLAKIAYRSSTIGLAVLVLASTLFFLAFAQIMPITFALGFFYFAIILGLILGIQAIWLGKKSLNIQRDQPENPELKKQAKKGLSQGILLTSITGAIGILIALLVAGFLFAM